MVQQLDYQYAAIPKKLMYCLDRNCRSMLFALVDLADYYDTNRFYRSNEDLQKDTDLSKNLVIATLATLYLSGLIDVNCIGKGTGRKTNIITVHTERFKNWEKYTFDEVRNLPELKINTVKYKGSGFKAPYMDKDVEASCYSVSQEVSQKVNTIEETIETQSTKENILYKDIENESQKVNTCNNDSKLPTCKIDIVEEEKSLKEFEEESFKDMKDSFNIVSTKVNLNKEMTTKGFICCSNFVNTYQNLDYQLLLNNPQQFLTNNDIKVSSLTQSITSSTGVFFSKQITIQLLKDYVELWINRQSQERTQPA